MAPEAIEVVQVWHNPGLACSPPQAGWECSPAMKMMLITTSAMPMVINIIMNIITMAIILTRASSRDCREGGTSSQHFPILGLSPKLRLTGPTCHQLTHHTNHTHPIDSHRLLCGVLPTRPGLIQCALHNAHSAMNELVPVWAQAPMEKTFSPPLNTTRGKLVSMKFCQNSVLVWYWSVLICPVGLSCSVLVWIQCSCQVLKPDDKKYTNWLKVAIFSIFVSELPLSGI